MSREHVQRCRYSLILARDTVIMAMLLLAGADVNVRGVRCVSVSRGLSKTRCWGA